MNNIIINLFMSILWFKVFFFGGGDGGCLVLLLVLGFYYNQITTDKTT